MRHYLLDLFLAASISTADAHVRIQPAESRVGAKQSYSVRVPTEGKIPTTSLVLDVPEGVFVISADGQPEMNKSGNRIVSLKWKDEIAPGQSSVYSFVAVNPANGDSIIWKAHQYYLDGTVRDWTDGPGSKDPAPVTKLLGVQ